VEGRFARGAGGAGSGRGQGLEARFGAPGKFGHFALRAPFRPSAERLRPLDAAIFGPRERGPFRFAGLAQGLRQFFPLIATCAMNGAPGDGGEGVGWGGRFARGAGGGGSGRGQGPEARAGAPAPPSGL
jgi:hypothetical protein